MPVEITMPQLSDTMAEGTLVKWVKQEGQKVRSGEVIAEVETDKATMEMEAFEGGTIAKIVAAEGQKVEVGGLLAVLATGKENPEQVKQKYSAGQSAQKPAQEKASVQGKADPSAATVSTSTTTATMEAPGNKEIHKVPADQHQAPREPISTEPANHDGNGHAERLRASPLARRIAADHGIDLNTVRGSGPNGRIVQKDVLEAQPASSTPAAGIATAPGQTTVVPLTKMRTAIAAALQRSKQQVPHFYLTIEVEMERVIQLRQRLNAQLQAEKIKLSVGDFVTRAVVAALRQHPGVNAHFNSEKAEITRFGDINLGIAVALPDGLIVPVLRNVNQMGLKEIRQRSVDLAERARNQRLKREELSGATFTVTNLGMYGITEFSAIINPPEVAILAVSAAVTRPVVRDNQIVPRAMMNLTLSADHRAVDGASGAEFLHTLKNLLEDPAMMLA